MRTLVSSGPLLVSVASVLVLSCVPKRDNGADPSVRPRPAIQVQVDGADTSIGGRNALWTLDSAGSEDPNGPVVRFEWSLSSGFTQDPEEIDEENWLPVGAEPVVQSIPGSDFQTSLSSVEDFNGAFGGPGTGFAFRWARLYGFDGNGNRGTTYALLTIQNRAPIVDLGPARRVAPGGRFRTATTDRSLDGIIDVLDAEPLMLTIEAGITDLDTGDAARAFTASNPGIWTIEGDFAEALDVDGNGVIDDAFFPDPVGRRTLRFGAPLMPSRNRIRVTVGDVNVAGEQQALSTDIVDADVLSSHWVMDGNSGFLSRLDTSKYVSQPRAFDVKVLASDGKRTLVAEQTSPSAAFLNIILMDHSFREVRRANSVVAAAGSYPDTFVDAATDGAGGWWVQDSYAGVLRHLTPTLTVNRTLSSVEGSAANDFFAISTALAPIPGTTDVWVLGGGTDPAVAGSSPASRLYRLTESGAVTLAIDALPNPAGGAPLPAFALAADGLGGVWIGGQGPTGANGAPARLRHVNAAGAELTVSDAPMDVLPFANTYSIQRMDFDVRHGTVWAVGGGSYPKVYRYASDGTWTSLTHDVGEVIADPSDDSAVVSDPFYGLVRYDAALHITGNIPVTQGQPLRSIVGLEGGSIVGVQADATLQPRQMLWIEGGEPFSRVDVPIYLNANDSDLLTFAVDPATGFVWFWRPTLGSIEVYSSEGVLLFEVPITRADGSRAIGASAGLAIDPDTRRVWIAWGKFDDLNPALSGGALLWIDLRDGISAPPVNPVPGFSFISVTDLAVVPGAQVCIAGTTVSSPQTIGREIVYRPSSGDPAVGTSVDATTGGFFALHAAAARDGSCWFAADPTVGATSVARVTASATVASTLSDGSRWLKSLDADFWTGRIWATSFNDSSANWLPYYGPALTGPTLPVAPVLAETGPFSNEAASVLADPFYRHVFVGFGDAAAGGFVEGRIVRFEPDTAGTLREIDRFEGFNGPRLKGTH